MTSRNTFAVARHNAENTAIAVSRNGSAPYMVFQVADLASEVAETGNALSLVAVNRWLAAKGIAASAIELERKAAMETVKFPYVVRVRSR